MSIINHGYKCGGAVTAAFLNSKAFVRAIRGPVGSGTSTACCMEMFRRMSEQEPNEEGLRKTRWAIFRQTNPQHETTTIKTWKQWFPTSHFGKFRESPPYLHTFRYHDIDAEVYFLPMKDPEDIERVLSLELTGAWINEARQLPKGAIDAITSRVGRYPAMVDGGPTWKGLLMDTNAPPPDHWWPIMSGEGQPPEWMTEEDLLMFVQPDNWEFFVQPPAVLPIRDGAGKITGYEVNPLAENLANLDPDYYPNSLQGKTREWISIYLENELGNEVQGRQVYRHFAMDLHTTSKAMEPDPNYPMLIGMDFGLTPAAVFGQRINGMWRIFKEIVTEDTDAKEFGNRIMDTLQELFPHHVTNYRAWGDPSGDYRSDHDKTTTFQILLAIGLRAKPAKFQDPQIRITAVETVHKEFSQGKPRLQMSQIGCPILIQAHDKMYMFRRMSTREEKYMDKPDKNRFSHVADAAQYLFSSEGEGLKAIRNTTGKAPVAAQAKRNYDPFRKKNKRKVWSRQHGM